MAFLHHYFRYVINSSKFIAYVVPLHRSAEAIKRHPYFSDLNWDRLEAGLTPVPFVPDPNQVYAKDVSDIRYLQKQPNIKNFDVLRQVLQKDRLQ